MARRTAASHPEALKEVHAVKVGFEILGYVGRFTKSAKSWYFAGAVHTAGKWSPVDWSSRAMSSRESAEQAVFSRWRLGFERAQADKADTKAREIAREIVTEEQQALAVEDALSLATHDQLVEALLRVDRNRDIESWAMEYCQFSDEDAKDIFMASDLKLADVFEDEAAELEDAADHYDLLQRLADGRMTTGELRHWLAYQYNDVIAEPRLAL